MAKPILLLAEQLRGQPQDITFEMLGVGRPLADALQTPLYALLVGADTASVAPRLGLADKVYVVDEPRLTLAPPGTLAAALTRARERLDAGLILVAGTNVSMGIGSALAAQTGLPFVNYCRGVKAEGGGVLLTTQLYGGKILADVRLSEALGIVSLYPGAFPAEAGKSSRTATVEPLALTVAESPVAFERYLEPEAGDVDITKQDVLVAVGRGIQTQDNLALAEDLAAALGGAVCASRPVIDQGWLPLSRQVGKSGMTVKPRLYFAVGISGAPEHWEGMQSSQTIVAVNTDPNAPIFDGAHYGICGDALELLPLLTEKVKARKG